MSDSGLSLASSSGPVSGDAGERVEETRDCGEYEEAEEAEAGDCLNIRSPAQRHAQARLTHGQGFLSKSVANISSSNKQNLSLRIFPSSIS